MKTPFVVYLLLENPDGWSTVEPFECSAAHPEIALRLAERRADEHRYGNRLVGIADVTVHDRDEPHLACMQHQPSSRPIPQRTVDFSAFRDPRWAGTHPSQAELAEALAEPASLMDLPDLETIRWDQLTHAYGSAHNVLLDLRRLASVDPDAREQALYELEGSIYHQGDLFEATACAIPFLVLLINSPAFPDREPVLEFLAEIAASADVNPNRRTETWRWRRKSFGEIYAKPTERMAAEQIQNDAAVREAFLRLRGNLTALQTDPSIGTAVAMMIRKTGFLRSDR